jgi:hypothetical protein
MTNSGVSSVVMAAFTNSVKAQLDIACLDLVIPENVSEVASTSTNTSRIYVMVLRRTTPPACRYNGASFRIYVPQGSLAAYKSATGWSAFADIMEEFTEETILW